MHLNKSNQVIKKLSPTGYKSLFSTEQANRIFSLPFFKSTKVVRSRSQYGMMLRESRKLSLLYGNLSKKYLQKIFKKSCIEPSKKKERIFSILESRLDVILYRASFFETIPAARQVVITGGIEVNKKKVISPGYIVLPGDLVEVLEKKDCSPSYQKHCTSKILKSKEKALFVKENNEGLPSLLSLKKLSFLKVAPPVAPKVPLLKFTFQEKPIEVLSGERREKKRRSSIEQVLLLYCKIKVQKTGILIQEITQALNRFKIKTKSQFVATGDVPLPHINVLSPKGKGQYDLEARVMPTRPLTGNNYLSKQNCTTLSQFNKENSLNDYAFLENKKSGKFLFKSDLRANKKSVKKERDAIEKYDFTRSNNFVFSNYRLKLKKQLFSQSLKTDYFYKQKTQLFFKQQIFFESKKTKPLHLEISFRSLSLIFLFPPQRVCFPTFINLSLIYK